MINNLMNYKEIIESKYNRQNWQLLLHDIFGNKVKFWNTPSAVFTNSQFAKQTLWLGTITLSDKQTISIYEVELADSVDIERNRRGIRDMLLSTWRNNGNAGAFMFCYRKNESVLRFSYVSESWTFAEDGTYQKESTDTKRFTYLLGEGHRSRTAIQQFEKLRDSKLSLKDLTKAFSVDAVSDMFFDGYKKQYEDIIQYITGKRMVKVANKWEEKMVGAPCGEMIQEFAHFANPEKSIRDYVKKLMGRLVFLQFLQKKGWLGVPANAAWGEGDTEFIQNLFVQCQDKDHFVDNVLEPLFNDLNTERKNDLSTINFQLSTLKVPYLNGGLFEREATDETNFPLPAKYMKSLLDFFASYNFTIDENDPDDAEVGVDPEMLGRIFENLLEDNKDKGAFYTPKEIVSYMCRESLIAYLQTDIEDEPTKEAIRQFVTTHNTTVLGENEAFRRQVDEALKNVKICDPAIGSGAFPMGLLKELFQCRTALEGISQHQAAAIKKHIIQQNIYGVDIERGAVDIARLRFWLSLIVDEETPQALPNLDFKIMQGNSLLEQYKGVDLSKITELKSEKEESVQLSWFEETLDVLRLDLRKKLDEYYNCTDHRRKAILKQEIIANVKQQIKDQSIPVDFGTLDLSTNNQFFLWHTWFYDVFSQGGFDIVIGNPPYKIVSHDDSCKAAYDGLYEVAHGGKRNLYHLFFEKGILVLQNGGTLSYITPDTYFSGNDTMALRQYLIQNTDIDTIVHYTEKDKVFKNVTQAVAVIVLSKQTHGDSFAILNAGIITMINYSGLVKENKFVFKSTNSVIDCMKTCSLTFGTVCDGYKGDVNLALKRDYFCYTNTKYTLPLVRGVQLSKYGYNPGDEYCFKAALSKDHTNRERIVFQEIANMGLQHRVKGTILKNVICGDSCNLLFTRDSQYDNRFILAVLNSKAVNYYFKFYNQTNHVPIGEIRNVPFPTASKEKQMYVIGLVNKILSAKRTNPSADTSALESEIDRLVYQLYGLTEEEIKVVEQS